MLIEEMENLIAQLIIEIEEHEKNREYITPKEYLDKAKYFLSESILRSKTPLGQ